MIHQRFLINQNVTSVIAENNICVECTIIRSEYGINTDETRMLFEPATIRRFVLGQNNMILSQM